MFVFLCLGLGTYLFWLDHEIRRAFEGKRWALPARVYAQPMEIYSGLEISKHDLTIELRHLGYRHVNKLTGPGEYQTGTNNVHVYTRKFSFWDGVEPSARFHIQFQADTISHIQRQGAKVISPILRLEPLLIGKIYPEHNEDRVVMPYDQVPPLLVDALIAIEDRNFFLHFGIDPKGIMRAVWANIKSGGISQGGSTLTQQLVKNYFLSNERTLKRKINELFMALLLEYRYSKAEILSAYINEIYLGQDGARAIHGFGTASEFYFSRPLNELSIAQLSLLVGIVKGASYYNPRRHPDRARLRRNMVIKAMLDRGYLTQAQASKASIESLGVVSNKKTGNYESFLDLVRRQLREFYAPQDLRTEGLRIFTTLNRHMQATVQQAIDTRLREIERANKLKSKQLQAAGIISSVDTGEILALIGGRSPNQGGFNRALDAMRPIGSLIKPAVYLTALSNPSRFNALSLLEDRAVDIKLGNGATWKPKNYDGKEHGEVPLYLALAKSYNLATVDVGMQLGLKQVVRTLHRLGIDKSIQSYPSLLLGSLELSPLAVTQMYQTLASGGFKVPLRVIREVLDKQGKPLRRVDLDIERMLDHRYVFLTNSVLSQVFTRGTARQLSGKFHDRLPLAGKTGTTNDLRDSWFAGFGSNYLGVVWVGRDDNQSAGLTGANGAMRVWGDMMQSLSIEPVITNAPEDVVWLNISSEQGDCDEALWLPFIKPNLPPSQLICTQ